MTGILDVASHYITEAKTSFYHETKEFLWKTYIQDWDGYQKFNSSPFAVMREADPDMIKRKLDGLCEGLVEASDCLDNLDLIVLGNDELMIHLKGDGLSIALKNHLKSIKERFTAKSKYSDEDISNRFVRRNNLWFIKYKSKEVTLHGTVGLCCIAFILMHQKDGMAAGNLVALCGTKADSSHELSMMSVDRKAIQQTFTGMKQLEKDIEKLRNENRECGITSLVQEYNDLQDYLSKNARWEKDENCNPKPVPKYTGGDNKSSNNVRINLTRAYDKLNESHKTLSSHLDKYIKPYKFKYYYKPKPPVEWYVDIE